MWVINLTSYISVLSVCLLKLEDASLFLLKDEEAIKLIFKFLLTEAVILSLEEIIEEDVSSAVMRVTEAW